MRLTLRLRPRAEADVADAYRWYEERDAGLGDAFLRAFAACLARIERTPDAFSVLQRDRVRRALLHRFPYGVFFVIREDSIDVLAVYHTRRRPRRFNP